MGNWGLGDWDDVRVFLAVVRHGSFTKAGEALAMRQSTVGRRVQGMEERLGAKLFDRYAGGMRPTPVARGVVRKAELMEDQALSLERQLIGTDIELRGEVRITGTEGIISYWLLPRFHPLLTRLPNVHLNLLVTPQILDLAAREADIALRFGEPSDPRLLIRKLGIVRFGFYASREYAKLYGLPKTLAEVADHCLLDNAGYHAADRTGIWKRFIQNHQHVPIRTSCTNPYIEAMRAALGIGVLPKFFHEALPDLIPLGIQSDFTMDLYLVTHEETRQSARIRAILDEIVTLAEADRRTLFS